MYPRNCHINNIKSIRRIANSPDTITIIHAPSGFGKSTLASIVTEDMISTTLLSLDSISSQIDNKWWTNINQITSIPTVIEGTSDNFESVLHIIEHLHEAKRIRMCVPIPSFDTYIKAMCAKAQAFKDKEGNLWKTKFLERSHYTPYQFYLYIENFLKRCTRFYSGIINIVPHEFDISIHNPSGWYER